MRLCCTSVYHCDGIDFTFTHSYISCESVSHVALMAK